MRTINKREEIYDQTGFLYAAKQNVAGLNADNAVMTVKVLFCVT